MLNGQSIDSGNNSTNIQGKDVTVINNSGLSYSDVKEITMDIFKSNFYNLGEKVEKIVQERAEKILDDYLEKLSSKNPEYINNTQEPDIRYVIYEAQKNYARRGEEFIEKLLVDILIERTTSKDDSLKSLILNEALYIIPKLTQKQIDVISFIFMIRYLNFVKEVPIESFIEIVNTIKSNFNLLPSDHVFEHLQYTSCISISIGSIEFHRILDMKFPQVKDENEARELISSNAKLRELSSLWNNSRCCNSSLTSVGIAIAIINIKIKIDLDLDMNVWIYE